MRWILVYYFKFSINESLNIFLLYSQLDKCFILLTFLSAIAWNDPSQMSWSALAWTCALASMEIHLLTMAKQFPLTASYVASFFFSISVVESYFQTLPSSLIFRNRRIQSLGFWDLDSKDYMIYFQWQFCAPPVHPFLPFCNIENLKRAFFVK